MNYGKLEISFFNRTLCVALGSALHLPVPAGTASGGVPPGSALHLPILAGAAGGGVSPGSPLHLPISVLVQLVVECPLVHLYTFQALLV